MIGTIIGGAVLGIALAAIVVGFIKLLGYRNPISGKWEWWG